MICLDTNIKAALRSRQRGFIMRPSRFNAGGAPVVYNSFLPTPPPSGTVSATLSNSNRTFTTNTTSGINANSLTPTPNVPAGKKAYWEITINTLVDSGVGYVYFQVAGSYIWFVYGYVRQIVGTNTTAIPYGASGMILQFAADDAAGKLWYGRDGTWYNTSTGAPNPAAGTGAAATFTPGSNPVIAIRGRSGSPANVLTINFGHTAWGYSAPSGFSSINA